MNEDKTTDAGKDMKFLVGEVSAAFWTVVIATTLIIIVCRICSCSETQSRVAECMRQAKTPNGSAPDCSAGAK